MLNQKKIDKLVCILNLIKLKSKLAVKKDGVWHTYILLSKDGWDEIDLWSTSEENSMWGSGGETVDEWRANFLLDGILGIYQDIKAIKA